MKNNVRNEHNHFRMLYKKCLYTSQNSCRKTKMNLFSLSFDYFVSNGHILGGGRERKTELLFQDLTILLSKHMDLFVIEWIKGQFTITLVYIYIYIYIYIYKCLQ